DEVCQLSNSMHNIGIRKGNRVCIYMPMFIESVVAILSYARISDIHSIVYAGISSQALADRINDAEAKLIITSDGLNRGNKLVDLKSMVDDAVENCPSIQNTIVLKVTNTDVNWVENRDLDYHTLIENEPKTFKAIEMDA